MLLRHQAYSFPVKFFKSFLVELFAVGNRVKSVIGQQETIQLIKSFLAVVLLIGCLADRSCDPADQARTM